MEATHCPNCHRIVAWNSHYCAGCGESFTFFEAGSQDADAGLQDARAGQEVSASTNGRRLTRPLIEQIGRRRVQLSHRLTSPLLDEEYEEKTLEFTLEDGVPAVAEPRHVTWQKVVETPSRPPAVHSPRPPRPPQSHAILRHMPYGRAHVSPVVFFWCCVIALLFLIGGGVFGIMGIWGRGHNASANGTTLQITPDDVAVGATIYLRGSGFSRHALLGLTRDAAIPIPDTSGEITTTSQGDGSFADTVIIGRDWVNGTHTISVEDAITHKFTSAPIQVTGMGDILGPAHLRISASALDLGTGDQATNSVKKIALTNIGDGEISWHASAIQPWLTISPKSGTFSSGMTTEVEIAGDRSGLQPGSVSDQVLFSSNAGDTVLPVTMGVTALQEQGGAVLQISPAALSFTSSDGGPAPDAQTITISNPGSTTLHWSAATSVPWLALSAQTGTVAASGSQSTQVNVDTRNLLPGSYSGVITVSGNSKDSAMHSLHSPQSIVVSVTITPGCALTIAPGMLTFTGAYQQAAPATKILDVTTNNCSSSIIWSASSNAPWLTIDRASSSTPARPVIGINTAGLKPGTYNSSVTFTSSTGTQDVPVKFVMGQPAEPALSVGSTSGLSFHGVAGQPATATQNVTLTNTGSAPLLWSAQTTTGGSNWLSVSPGSGSIPAHQAATIVVAAETLASMSLNTYAGTLNITATDERGNAVAGSPQHIPINNIVVGGCAVSMSSSNLTFVGNAGPGASTDPANQVVTLSAGAGCNNTVNWTASAASDNGGGTWLSTTSWAGSLGANTPRAIGVKVSLAGLSAGSYHGTITVSSSDSVTHTALGNPQVISVVLNVQGPCALLAPSTASLTFNTQAGSSPAAQNFSIGIAGSCQGNITIVPTTPANTNWLSVSPAQATASIGSSASFGVAVDASKLLPGQYTATINLASSSANGLKNSQGVNVVLNVQATQPATTPAPTVSPTALTFNIAAEKASQSITLSNNGNSSFHWQASIQAGAPPFVSLSNGAGADLTVGNSVALSVDVDATGMSGKKSYKMNIIINSVNSTNGAAGSVGGSKALTIPVTINVAVPTPTPTPVPTPVAVPTPGLMSTPDPVPISGSTPIPSPVPTPTSVPTPVPVPISISTPVSVPTFVPTPTLAPTSAPTAVPTPDSLLVSSTTLSFSTEVGTNPAPQKITLTDVGHNGVSWRVSAPSRSWLLVSPTGGLSSAGTSSTLTLSADVTGLTPKTYVATVVLTVSGGHPVTLQVLLKVSNAPPKPTIVPDPTPPPVATFPPRPTPAPTPTPVATLTPVSDPTSVATPTLKHTLIVYTTQTGQTGQATSTFVEDPNASSREHRSHKEFNHSSHSNQAITRRRVRQG
ncbi:MAG: hypothetical protein NVS2B12_01480 [Ktedonobacteraceae bacterium]